MDSLPLFQTPSLSVSDLTRYLRNLLDLDELLQDVWVQGEASNVSRPSSGHIYFTLKDGGAALRCVIWRSGAQRMRFDLQNGQAVEAHGAVSVYERDGQYQLYVDALRPAGEGLLYQEFMRLKTRLEAEGLFDEEHKRPIPDRPTRIGIITSPTGAALQDMLNTLRARYPLALIFLAPCAVQGEAAPAEIVLALECLCRQAAPDVILMARGGGSLEDLWAFNDERVVRAVAQSPVPIITGVGHETDFTLVDFAADLRAPTPTGAAMLATPDQEELRSELRGLQSRLENAALAHIAEYQQGLQAAQMRLGHASPQRRIQDERQALDTLRQRAQRSLGYHLQLGRARSDGLANRLMALNPRAILARGYALLQHADGRLIHTVQDVQVGEAIRADLVDGVLQTRVTQVEAWEERSTNTGGA